MKVLLDTDICIEIIRKQPASLIKKITSHKPGDIGISSTTIAELQFGVEKSSRPEQNREALDQFLLPFEIVDFDYGSAVEYGRLRAELERAGAPIGSLDLLIAAQAVSLGVPLATNNVRELSRVPGLTVEAWARERHE